MRVNLLSTVRTPLCYCSYVVKKLTKTGNSLALVLDKPLLQRLGIDEDTDLEISTNGDVLVVTPVRARSRERKIKKILEELDREYGGVFQRLAE